MSPLAPDRASTPVASYLPTREHPLRRTLADEVHARPASALETPSRASYVAVMIDASSRGSEVAHFAALCEAFGHEEPPGEDAIHFHARFDGLDVIWERHGEFSDYTFVMAGTSPTPFGEPAIVGLPAGWLAGIPGQTIVAAHAMLTAAATTTADARFLAACFEDNPIVGSAVGDGAACVYTDFLIHADGFSRFVVVDTSLTARQAGRTVNRLFEIEAYRTMALLAFPIARRLGGWIATVEKALSSVTADIAGGSGDDEALLQNLTRLAAEVETELTASQFRFGACRAYAEIVTARIDELRECRLSGIQPIGEFMARRFTPAVATCATTARRLHGLSERVARASALLSTRVDIATERQNQALLASLDRRAKIQLRLQQTVEGLSVAAIVYYAAGLVGYVAKALAYAGLAIRPDLVIGASIPVLVGLVLLATRRARRRIFNDDRGTKRT
jgi:uncharacterized membrane-anchored protein